MVSHCRRHCDRSRAFVEGNSIISEQMPLVSEKKRWGSLSTRKLSFRSAWPPPALLLTCMLQSLVSRQKRCFSNVVPCILFKQFIIFKMAESWSAKYTAILVWYQVPYEENLALCKLRICKCGSWYIVLFMLFIEETSAWYLLQNDVRSFVSPLFSSNQLHSLKFGTAFKFYIFCITFKSGVVLWFLPTRAPF
jgi:hypothetical protein